MQQRRISIKAQKILSFARTIFQIVFILPPVEDHLSLKTTLRGGLLREVP